ncbi:ABC-2 transporter permease [Oxalobacteraceae bacterium OM1]|nr:ABC-2 transporter permease [Oxalobacteraceae bacterium OM1]
MTALLALIRTDIKLFLSDRRALMLRLGMPILLGAFFGYLFGGSGASSAPRLQIAVVAQDDSDIGRKVTAGLRGDGSLQVSELPLDEARAKVLGGKLNAAVVIPSGFGDAAGSAFFGGGKVPQIDVYYDPSQNAVLPAVRGLLTQQVMQVVSAEMFGGQAGKRALDRTLSQLEQTPSAQGLPELRQLLVSVKAFQQADGLSQADGQQAPAGMRMPFTTHEEAMSSGPQYNGYAHSFAGMSVQFILFLGIDVGIAMLLARRQGLWNRLLAAPVGMGTVLGARVLSSALIAFGLLCAIFAAAAVLFKVQVAGSLVGFLGIGVCFALMTAAFGLFIAGFGKTPEAARGLAVFATLIMVMLGGAWVPSFLFPQWLQTATLAVPTRWAVDGLDAMTWRGLGLEAAWQPMLVLLGFTVLFGLLALWSFRAEARR